MAPHASDKSGAPPNHSVVVAVPKDCSADDLCHDQLVNTMHKVEVSLTRRQSSNCGRHEPFSHL